MGASRSRIDRPSAVFDIETQGWDKYVLGGLYTPSASLITKDEDELVDAILRIDGDVWAHNGGKFDFLWLAEKLRQRKHAARLMLRGGSILMMDTGSAILRDSYAIVPMKLSDAAQIAGSYKAPLGFPCECGRDCGGYSAIRRGMSPERFKLLAEYLQHDLKALWDLMCHLVDYSADVGLELRATIGATAWATAREMLGLENAEWGLSKGDVTYHAARSACYGGRCEVYDETAESAYYNDINSAYPDQCETLALPIGKPRYVSSREAAKAYGAGSPGHYDVRISVPPCDLPPLPSRRNGRIVWGYGDLQGAWTGDELHFAEDEGARITEIGPSIVWPDREVVLQPFIEKFWPMRQAAGPKSPLGKFLKLTMNSLTGKFSQRPELELHALGPTPRPCPGDAKCDGIHHPNRCCVHRCTGTCGSWQPVGHPRSNIWSRKQFMMPTSAHVQWYSHILTHARKKQRDGLTLAGDGRIYGDTDSSICRDQIDLDIGSGLGQWDCEMVTDWLGPWPKFYRYLDSKGKWQGRGKGIPRGRDDWERYVRGEPVVTDRGVETLKTVSRTSGTLFRRKWLERKRADDLAWTGSRRRNPGGKSEAVDVAEWDYLHGHDSRKLYGYSDGVKKDVKELSREYGVSGSTIRKWIHAGLLDSPEDIIEEAS
jgi:hypothetical protein